MAISTAQKEYVSHVVDLLQGMGPVYSRRMFGGFGLFLDGLMFALVADNVLYLKCDSELEPRFTALGLAAFTYRRQGKTARLNYYQAPEEALEDPTLLLDWANSAYGVALRAAAAKARPIRAG